MKYAINLNSVLPVRSEASEKSEMVTQLLFGEICEVDETAESFIRIKNTEDAYTGWADKKMLTQISAEEYHGLNTSNVFRVSMPVADVFCLSDKTMYRLSAGSFLPNYNVETSKFGVGNTLFQIHPDFVTYLPHSSKDSILSTAKVLLNTPYLWGGKTVMGIDCSGFVQLVFSLNGFKLSRDASQQAKEGLEISFSNALEGDLFFFGKENKITHVGIYAGDGRIIHASGRVKINTVDITGIYCDEISEYTHFLSLIRRIE